jgi:hypothetical protein
LITKWSKKPTFYRSHKNLFKEITKNLLKSFLKKSQKAITVTYIVTIGWSRGRLAIVAMRQLPRGFFVWECEALFKKAWHFKDLDPVWRHFQRNWGFFLINVRIFEKLWGFFKTFSVEMRLFESYVRLLKKSKFFLKHLKRTGSFFKKCDFEAFSKNLRFH